MNSTQADHSVYQALNPAISEIRVLTIHQVSLDEELRCTLKTVSLDDQPAFHALSYAWGTEIEKCRININGHVVPISLSLAKVLAHFRFYHYEFLELHSLPLWVDAVCINQSDSEERAQQVRLMGEIYRQAYRVLCWIGEGDEFSDYAFDRMNDATFQASSQELKTTSRTPTLDEVRVSLVVHKNIEERRYWTRVWTLQEVVLASEDPIIICGSRRLLWSWYMVYGRDWLYQSLYPSLASDWAVMQSEVPWYNENTCSGSSRQHMHMRREYQKSGAIPLTKALLATLELDATDPRDRTYGILGLIPHPEMLMVDIDYRKTPEQVSRDAMTATWISGTDTMISSLLIPRLLLRSWAMDEDSEAPSWAPKVFEARRKERDNVIGLYEKRLLLPEIQANIHVEGNILTIKAIRFDMIADTVTMDFDHEWDETLHRGNAPGELDIEPLQDIEAMAQRGFSMPVSTSSRLEPLSTLRGRFPVWNALTDWIREETDGWVPGVVRDKEQLWEILLGRQEIPEHWKTEYPPKLRNNLPALEAAILSPLLVATKDKIHDRKVFISEFGFLGVSTKQVEAGDVISLILGVGIMYVLRPFQDGYRLVGFAGVSGLMNLDDLDKAMEAGYLHEEEMKIY